MKTLITVLMAVSFVATPSFAEEAQKPAAPLAGKEGAMTKEQREKMASVHEQMAVCLRSDKTLKDCHEEMRSTCESEMGAKGCPMMGMHHRKMMRKGMKHSDDT